MVLEQSAMRSIIRFDFEMPFDGVFRLQLSAGKFHVGLRRIGAGLDAARNTFEMGNSLFAVEVVIVINRDLGIGKLPGAR